MLSVSSVRVQRLRFPLMPPLLLVGILVIVLGQLHRYLSQLFPASSFVTALETGSRCWIAKPMPLASMNNVNAPALTIMPLVVTLTQVPLSNEYFSSDNLGDLIHLIRVQPPKRRKLVVIWEIIDNDDTIVHTNLP